MKLYLAYKKQFKIFLLIVLVFLPFVFSYAQTAVELNNKINQKNNDIAALEKEIKQYQLQLDALGKQKSSLNGSIKELDLTRKKLVADMNITQNKIDQTNFKIQGLSFQIGDKEEIIQNNTEAIKIDIRKINEIELDSITEKLLSEVKISDVWNDIDNMVTVRNKIRQNIIDLKQVKNELEFTKKKTTDARNELVSLKNELADQKKIVVQNTNDKKKLLAQTKNNEANYQKLLKDRLAKKDAFEKDLRDYESQLKYILDPLKLPGSGVLSWPLDYIYITQLFGKTEAGKRLYASGSHNGEDFRAPVGTPVKAMADGIVAGIGDTDLQCPGVSFGRFVLIKYDNGLASTFGHFSLIKVKTGERVSRGQIVGYSGNTGYSTGPHLHVSVYARDAVNLQTLPSKSCPGHVLTQPISPINAYLDPSYYLPPYKKP
ncbi:MAG: peptidoglycan DD-metalloendopeptidase family protein [Minisyncoccia bacterium]